MAAPVLLSHGKELVSDLETRIARYLDGESSPAEQAELQELFERSPEARALLREMTALRRAARGLPSMDAPRRVVEARLFRQLEAEGLSVTDDEPRIAPLPEVISDAAIPIWRPIIRYGSAVAAIALLVLMFGSERLIAPGAGSFSDESRSGVGGPIAAVAPSVTESIVAGRSSHHHTAASGSTNRPGMMAAMMSDRTLREAERPAAVRDSAGDTSAPALADVAGPDHASVPVAENQAPVASLRRALGASSGVMMGAAAQHPAESSSPMRIHRASQADESSFAASIRPGVSYIGKGGGLMAQEMSVRFDATLGQNHQISLIAGSAPTVSETRTDRTPLPASVASTSATRFDNSGNNKGLSGSTPPATALQQTRTAASGSVLNVQSETWLGLGYTYTIAPVENIRFGAGVKAGSSASAWRVGFELPLRYRMMPGISFEAVPSATLVAPRDRSPEAYAADGTAGDYTYQGTTRQLSFTSIGLEVGLRIEFGGH